MLRSLQKDAIVTVMLVTSHIDGGMNVVTIQVTGKKTCTLGGSDEG